MSKVKTVKDSTARLVRFNSADDNEDDGIRKSRRLRGQDPPLQLDPLNIPLTGPQELRVREEKNTARGRTNQKPKGAGLLSGLLRRNRTERSKSEDSEGSDHPKESTSDPEGKRTGARKKPTFGRERSRSYTSQSSQSSRSPSRERKRGNPRQPNLDWENPLRTIASTGGRRPVRPPPPHWGVKQYGGTSTTQQKCIRWRCVTWLKSAVNEILSTKCEVALKITHNLLH